MFGEQKKELICLKRDNYQLFFVLLTFKIETTRGILRYLYKQIKMGRPRTRKSSKVKELKPKIKVRLDSKTIITIRDMGKLDFWKEKYPDAIVVQ